MTYFKGARFKFEPVRLAAFGAVGASYAALVSALENEAAFLMITSSLNSDAYLSFDGVTEGSPSTDVSAILKKWADEFDEMYVSAKENADSSAGGDPSFVPEEVNKPKEESAPLPEQE